MTGKLEWCALGGLSSGGTLRRQEAGGRRGVLFRCPAVLEAGWVTALGRCSCGAPFSPIAAPFSWGTLPPIPPTEHLLLASFFLG